MIANLRLQHFRSYADASFEFNPGVNIIVGPNASGKTNLLEAVLVTARGSSYRVADADLVMFEQPWARLDGVMSDDTERIIKLVQSPRPSKSYDIGGKPLKRLTAQYQLPVVLFEPNHLMLLSGSPDGRRAYLDDLLEQTLSGYQNIRLQYARTLRQRNALLKRGPSVAEQLFPWNLRLSELAGKIVRARSELVITLNDRLAQLYKDLSHSPAEVLISYESKFEPLQYESLLLKKLEANQDIDFARGFTGNGPHREDFTVTYDGREATETASRGEIRTAVLALKIMELQILEQASGQRPIILLDDVFSELDGSRRKLLTSYIEDYQAFITTTDADIVVDYFLEKCNVIAIASER
ncbi:MAG TPA: DNA replication and repair protein RecF [Candidatus Saccharimonadales bacterium]